MDRSILKLSEMNGKLIMLTRLDIRNFQKWKKLSLLFEKITVFTGPSDEGKSAILRALYWICFNRPEGTSFITHGEEEVKVRLLLDDHSVVRKKGKENTYALDGNTFKAFGRDRPEPVGNVLCVDELNFQRQLDPPLWFFESGGEIARHLNRIVQLDSIDLAHERVASRLRRAKASHEVCCERLDKAEKRRKELSWLPDALRASGQVREKEEALEELKSKRNKLKALIQEIHSLEELIKTPSPLKEIKILEMKMAHLQDAKKIRDKYKAIIERIKEEESCRDTAIRELEETKRSLKENFPKNCPLCNRPM